MKSVGRPGFEGSEEGWVYVVGYYGPISCARSVVLTNATSGWLPQTTALPAPYIGNRFGRLWRSVLGRAGTSGAVAERRTRGKIVCDAFAADTR